MIITVLKQILAYPKKFPKWIEKITQAVKYTTTKKLVVTYSSKTSGTPTKTAALSGIHSKPIQTTS